MLGTGTRWRVSAAWFKRPHDCTLRGIRNRCGAACCHGYVYWPPRTGGYGDCPHLGLEGCTLDPVVDRPVTCLLYPVVLNKAGTLVLHNRATTAQGICKGNHGRGEPLIDSLADNLAALFGAEQVARVRAAVMEGRDSYFDVPEQVERAYEAEQLMDHYNV